MMKNLFEKIINFIKLLFNNTSNVIINNDKVNNVKNNKKCNINIENNGVTKNEGK